MQNFTFILPKSFSLCLYNLELSFEVQIQFYITLIVKKIKTKVQKEFKLCILLFTFCDETFFKVPPF